MIGYVPAFAAAAIVAQVRWYPLLATAVALATVAAELLVLRTGLFRMRPYWLAMAICFAFMMPTDGWLTKLSAPIVIYDDDVTSGGRLVWDIPNEEFLYGFAALTIPMLTWLKLEERAGHRRAGQGRADAGSGPSA